jgi:hypothetical protein
MFPYIVIENTSLYQYPSEFGCRLFCMLRLFLPAISAFVFLLISIQRYLLVCKPFGPKMTLFWKRLSFVSACGIAMAITAPALGISGILTSDKLFLDTNITVRLCTFSKTFSVSTALYFGIILLVLFCCVIATITLYIPVLKQVKVSILRFRFKMSNIGSKTENSAVMEMNSGTIFKSEEIEMENTMTNDCPNASKIQLPTISQGQTNASYSETPSEDYALHSTFSPEQGVKDKTENQKRERRKQKSVQWRLTMIFFVLILAYLISYFPPLVILILTYTRKDFNFITLSETETLVWIYISHLILLNHVINPFIYGYFDTQFRKKLILCLKNQIPVF